MDSQLRYKIHNLDRAGSMPHVTLDTQYDRGIVYDMNDKSDRNPFTQEMQPKAVFWGTIPECCAWVRREVAL